MLCQTDRLFDRVRHPPLPNHSYLAVCGPVASLEKALGLVRS
jgi:hypothetical protein